MTVNIGIDLGTTYSCLAYSKSDGIVNVQHDKAGNSTVPSVVLFKSKDEVLVGEEAKTEAIKYSSTQTVETIKREMGLKKERVFFESKYNPPTISAFILKKMIDTFKNNNPDEEIGCTVIAHPAYFGNSQINATKEAGIIAGIPSDKLFLLDEPTAIAISNTHDKGLTKRMLVYDLGGGTFDVSILDVNNNDINCIAIAGDKYLGGKDWDKKLIDLCITKIIEAVPGSLDADAIMKDSQLYATLRFNAESIKIKLSKERIVSEKIDYRGHDIQITITRKEFENLTRGKVNNTMDIIDRCLSESGLSKEDIDEIIVAGGASNMPMIKDALRKKFEGKEINSCINGENAVAIGAAIFANTKNNEVRKEASTRSNETIVVPVLSKTYGVRAVNENDEDVISNILFKNTKLPTKETKKYRVYEDNQECLEVEIFENDGIKDINTTMSMTKTGQTSIGKIMLELPKNVTLQDIIEVIFEVDNQKSMFCTVKCRRKKKTYEFVPETAMTTEQIVIASRKMKMISPNPADQ